MLGRLFSGSTTGTLSQHHHSPLSINGVLLNNASGLNSPSVQAGKPSYEDSYTRTLLYGTADRLNPVCSLNEFQKLFRVVIFQDGRVLNTRQVLFDSAVKQQTSVQNGANKVKFNLNTKMFHNYSELSEYMFGSGVPINDSTNSIKLHILPDLPYHSVHKVKLVLITRLFSTTNRFDSNFGNHSTSSTNAHDQEWVTHPTIDLSIKGRGKRSGATNFGIGLVIPISLENCLNTVIGDNWEELTDYACHLQFTTTNKLQKIYNLQQLTDSKDKDSATPNFSSFVLQNDVGLHQLFQQLIKLMSYLVSTPRVLLGFSSINSCTILNWTQTVAYWMDIKDGRSPGISSTGLHHNYSSQNIKFLASLLSILIPMRHKLLNKPTDKTKAAYRVVIMSGNPIISSKLIYILTVIFADTHLLFINKDKQKAPNQLPKFTPPSFPNSDLGMKANETSPIPIHRSTTKSNSPRTTPSSIKIPQSFRRPTAEASSSVVTTNGIITTDLGPGQSSSGESQGLHINSSYNSLQNLSTSLSSNSVSHSWKHHGLSLLEKWKAGYNPASNSLSVDSHRHLPITPSPSMDYEEYPWTQQLTPPTSLAATPAETPFPSIHRAKSFVDLHGDASTYNNTVKYRLDDLPKVKRDATTVKTIIYDRNESSSDRIMINTYIKTQCEKIMNNDDINYALVDYPGHSQPVLDISGQNFTECLDSKLNLIDEKPDILYDSFMFNKYNKNHFYRLHHAALLTPICGFVDEYRPEFSIQACPISQHLEQQIITSLKYDTLSRNSHDSVLSETIFVSLRAREIKSFKICDEGRLNSSGVKSPVGDFSLLEQLSRMNFSGGTSPTDHEQPKLNSNVDHHWDKLQVKTKVLFPQPLQTGVNAAYVNKIDSYLGEVASLYNDLTQFSSSLQRRHKKGDDVQEKLKEAETKTSKEVERIILKMITSEVPYSYSDI
ncbi:hypothetical protein LJB42_002119 [Komagataella kurtzmanii]|nr:hypothetical protein LJB42_002119 [Komagataella kurtzmanii]